MNFEQPPQINNNEEEKTGPFNKYNAETYEEVQKFIKKLEEFERNLPNDPEELLAIRKVPSYHAKENELIAPKEKEQRWVDRDIEHAVNRKLNELGYEEK